MDIIDKIKKARVSMGLTQKDLAEATGISVSAINKYESKLREPKKEQLIKIAKFLKIPLSELIDEDTEIYTTPPAVMIEKIISDLYQFEVDTKNKRVHIYNNDGILLTLSIKEFNLLTNDVVEYINNKIKFLNNLKKADIDG